MISADMLRREVRNTLRTMVHSSGFTIIVLVTLALGIGATTAIFTILDRVVLRPLPYADSNQLVWIDSPTPGVSPDSRWAISTAEFFYFKKNAHTLQDVGTFNPDRVTVVGKGSAEQVSSARVSASLFNVLRLHPALGRLLTPSDNRPNTTPVVVLGYGYWQRHFNGDPRVVGSVINIESTPTQIVGVLQKGAVPPDARDPVDVWLPQTLDEYAPAQNHHFLKAIGRLKSGVSTAAAQAELAGMTKQFTDVMPSAYSPGFMQHSGFTTAVTALRDHVVGDLAKRLWILLAAVSLVLVIACANVANLFLVRAEGRQREVAIRSALGAKRANLAWQYFTETVLLSAVAGVIGFVLAVVGIRAVLALAPADFPRLAEIHAGWESVVFAAITSVAAGLLFGALALASVGEPARHAAMLREGARGLSLTRRQRVVRSALVTGQTALALMLLAAAGLLLQSFRNLRNVAPGFDANGVLTAAVNLPSARYDTPEKVEAFYRELMTRVAAIPGVKVAGAGNVIPLDGNDGCGGVWTEDHQLRLSEEPPCVLVANVAPGYFRTLGIKLRGSEPRWGDVERRSGEVIVTKALADRLWPGQNPIGKGIKDVGNRTKPPWYHVVGVTDELRGAALDAPPTQALYLPMLPMAGQRLDVGAPRYMNVLLRSANARPEALVAPLRRVLADLDPNIPLAKVQTMDAVVEQSMARLSFTMMLLGIAAGTALILSAVGIYGVISYIVGRRTGEIGIRMALGARASRVGTLVVMQSLRMAALGVAIGIVGALATTRVLRAVLFDVSPTDPVTLVAVAVTMLVIAVLASYAPAQRAMRVDPVEALRAE